MPTFMDEREYSIENITKDKNKFNYWVPKLASLPHSLYLHPKPQTLLLHQVSFTLSHIHTLVSPLIPLGISHSSSHIHPPDIVLTNSALSNNFFPS